MRKVILFVLFILVASVCAQESRREERREERQEERREKRRKHRHPAPPPVVQPRTGPWTGILDSGRAIDWQNPVRGVIGGIPTNRAKCTLPTAGAVNGTIMPTGLKDITDANNINQALQLCAGLNQYVLMGPGTFYIWNGLTFGGNFSNFRTTVNNATLRGSGPDKTTLVVLNQGNQECGSGVTGICISADRETTSGSSVQYYPYGGACSWTAGYPKGSTVLTATNCVSLTGAALAAGMQIILDQRNDDIGLTQCTSSGTTATCTVSLAALPSSFVNGACVGVGQTSVSGYVGPAQFPYQTSANCQAIFNASGNTFSYTLPNSGSNLATSTGGYATVDTGSLYVTGVNGATSTEFLDIGRQCPDNRNPPPPTCQSGESSARSNIQIATLTAVSGSCATSCQLTIDTPVYATNWRTSQAPGIWWFAPVGYHHDVGVEDFTIDYALDGGGTGIGGIMFHACYNCWVRNVRSLNGSRNHIWITDGSAHITIRDCYFYGTKRGYSQSYGIELFGVTGDNLIENNVFVHVVTGIMNGGTHGSVESYNTYYDDGYSTTGWNIGSISLNHDVNSWILEEGDNSSGAGFDNIHGTISGVVTMFRNWQRGQNNPAKNNAMAAVTMSSFNRGLNAVGNVLGSVGTQSGSANYDYNVAGANITCTQCIYYLAQRVQSTTFITNDPISRGSVLRWGNYDVITGAVASTDGIRWCGVGTESGCSVGGGISEMPSAFSPFLNANAVPSTHNLPTSFYLTAQPSWWTTVYGTPPWPAVGPDVIGSSDPASGGHAYKSASGLAYVNLPLDSSYVKTATITSGSWSANLATLTGSFDTQTPETIQITGAAPASYNGLYQVYSSNGLNAGGSPNPYMTSGSSTLTQPAGTVNGYVRIGMTRVNAVGETSMGGVGGVSIPSTCPTSGNCVIAFSTPLCNSCTSNGSANGGGQMGTGFNVYAAVQGATDGLMCKQNTTPIPIATTYTIAVPLVLPPSACVTPPAHSTIPATSISYSIPSDPGGPMTTMGTVTTPLIQTFNADNIYGSGVTPPPSTPGITGNGKITGQGKIT